MTSVAPLVFSLIANERTIKAFASGFAWLRFETRKLTSSK